jgi:hypothetical protein
VYEAVLVRVDDDLYPVAQRQLRQDARDMGLGGALADVKPQEDSDAVRTL